MSSAGMTSNTSTSKRSHFRNDPEPTPKISKAYGQYRSLTTDLENFGSGSFARDGGDALRWEVQQRKTQYSSLLRREMKKQGVTHKELATAAGVSDKSVAHWVYGRSMPKRDRAEAVADYMMSETLRKLATFERRCVNCNDLFRVQGTRWDQVYCGKRCNDRVLKRESHERTVMTILARAKQAEAANDKRRDAITALCNACTDAFCPDPEGCPIAIVTHKHIQPR